MDGLTFTCPVCGADVPRRAKACPDCGACEKSGWSQDQYLDGLSLPGEGFERREYHARELGYGSKKTPMQRFWLIVTLVIIVAFLLLTLRGMW